jgi:signal transduction histidine kinase/iron only hydrogenase large subunit-like protein
MILAGKALVRSIKERCRVCYACVRECPAKAIRIEQGQAEVIADRCIGCGNCFSVCNRNAKEVLDTTDVVESLLGAENPVAALLAPSFPVEFIDMSPGELVRRVRMLGFKYVNEVAFGADLVAGAYKQLLRQHPEERYIAANCPAIVSYVEKYMPMLVDRLAPIVSPMVAMARVMKQLHGNGLKVVFIGPCIAKKAEERETDTASVDAVLTFSELRSMMHHHAKKQTDLSFDAQFDPPYAGKGRLFPIARGLLETAGIADDLISGDIVVTDGRENFIEALNEFEKNDTPLRFLEVLSCRGCIMGAGIDNTYMPIFQRRAVVGRYTREMQNREPTSVDEFRTVGLFRSYMANDMRLPNPPQGRIAEILEKLGKNAPEDELNCGACGYETCRKHAVAILKGIAETEMCLPYVIDQLKTTVAQLAQSNEEVAETKVALMQSEKMASMGQLAAGVAHEVNNPLGIVLMYAHLLLEEHGANPQLHDDLTTIVEQADRCKRIISGLLDFSRQNTTMCRPADMAEIINETLKTMSFPKTVNVSFQIETENRIAEVDNGQVAQILVNLLTNAVAAMPAGGELVIRLGGDAETVKLSVQDTGIGIPEENVSKIFDPFFTTKQIGKGTGLGLAVLYGIVKMHRGNVTVKSNCDSKKGPSGTLFTILLPRYEKSQ